jgi:mono/diheme cytochrome c family protein
MRVAIFVAGLAMIVAAAYGAQRSPAANHRTVWSGVFTAVQAERGASLFRQHCEACHGSELRGNEGPALVGPPFTRNWTGLTVRELFRHIRVAMPEDAPSSVSDAEKVDILAFVFQKNGFPAGTQTMTANAVELAAIAFEGQNGPEPPPTGATVLAVGCLTSVGAGTWTLTQASEPVRTTLEAVQDPDVHDASETPLGTTALRLLGVPGTNLPDGQKVAVVGFMTRAAASTQTDGINVLELSTLGECLR